MKLQNLGQRVYEVADTTVNAGGAVFSGLFLGPATYNFSNGFYSSAIPWVLLSLIGGISVYYRAKRNNLEQVADTIKVTNNLTEEITSRVEEITEIVEADPEVVLNHRKH